MKRYLLTGLDEISRLVPLAEIVEFKCGKVVVCWIDDPITVVVHDNIDSVKKIHCEIGKKLLMEFDDSLLKKLKDIVFYDPPRQAKDVRDIRNRNIIDNSK